MISVIGIIGGGQLAKMIAMDASKLGYKIVIFTNNPQDPAIFVTNKSVIGDYNDDKKIEEFCSLVDIVTIEFENIPTSLLKKIEQKIPTHPNSNILYISQNRIREKDFVSNLGIKTAEYYKVSNLSELMELAKKFNYNAIVKLSESGYDGKGQYVITKDFVEKDLEEIWNKIDGKEVIIEKKVGFEKELSILVARNKRGEVALYNVAENIHKNGILATSTVPANISDDIEQKIGDIAKKIATNLDLVGILAIEFFLDKNGDILVNEMAPRPHNSFHWTMDGCYTSQFEQLVRAICNLNLGSTKRKSKIVMENLIGEDINKWRELQKIDNAKLHIYGKNEIKEGRKMGHVNFIFPEENK